MDIGKSWHFRLREQPPVILIGLIEKLEKKYKCKDDIEETLEEIQNRQRNRFLEKGNYE